MKTAIATVSISGTLEEKLPAIAAAGFDGVEIFENDLVTFPGSPADIAAMARDLGLDIALYQPFRDFEGMPDEVRARTLARAERKFEVMRALGTDLVLVCSNCSPAALPDRARILDDFRALGDLAARHGVRIGYEALAWGRHVSDHRDAWSIVRDVDHLQVGLILDSFHSLSRGIPSASIAEIAIDKLFFVQLADAPRLEMDLLSWSRHFRTMPGQGELDVERYVAEILGIGYDGWLSLEIFNDRFRSANAGMIARDGIRSLRNLTDAVARRPGSTHRTALTPPATPSKVAFIEFAVEGDEAAQLRTMIAALGFSRIGQHRTKQVERWNHADINLVLNCEPEGFAHTFATVHGASVCAVGLVVDDVAAAQARASALAIAPFAQAVGPDEFELPSLRGVGGSLIYLIERGSEAALWAAEFEAVTTPDRPPTLSAVDHIAYTMPYDEFLSWVLFFVAQFGMKPTPLVEINDTAGLVQSQAVESADGRVRFTLNGSAAHQTLASRFVYNAFGAGAQHIALSSGNAVAAAQAARAAGLEILPIPANYYDDIAARFALDDGFVALLAANDLLYDREGEAEYLQFYSRAFGKRVFFEIVERRDYRGYGAANATVRLGAQARFKPKADALV